MLLERFRALAAGGTDGCPGARLRLRRGTRADYAHLAPWHYRAGPPATVVRVLAAVDPGPGAAPARDHGAWRIEPSPCWDGLEPVAVLVVSMPVLNGAWRRVAWPGRYDGPDRGLVAARINERLRTIARVVVDPRYRGLGVAARLVRAYLRDPLTPDTEAVAAMGRFSDFFVRAGMTPHAVPESRRDRALRRALRARGVRPAGLLDARARARLARDPAIRTLLRRWARDSRQSARLADAPSAALLLLAGARLGVRLGAYTHSIDPAPVPRAPSEGGADATENRHANRD